LAQQREEVMQYVLLIYQGTTPLPTDPDAWATLSEDEQKAIYKDYAALNKSPGVSPGLTLGRPDDATTVQVQDGKTVIRDGPYLSEGAGGYLIFEADDLDAAIDLASLIPAARHGGAIEIRPVATYW
jgi:hypothetical protein